MLHPQEKPIIEGTTGIITSSPHNGPVRIVGKLSTSLRGPSSYPCRASALVASDPSVLCNTISHCSRVIFDPIDWVVTPVKYCAFYPFEWLQWWLLRTLRYQYSGDYAFLTVIYRNASDDHSFIRLNVSIWENTHVVYRVDWGFTIKSSFNIFCITVIQQHNSTPIIGYRNIIRCSVTDVGILGNMPLQKT